MKLILRGKAVEDGPIADAIYKILGDRYSRKILESLTDSSKSALDISKDCKMSLTLAYRKLNKLKKYDLVQTSNSVLVEGRKYAIYKSKAHPMMVLLNHRMPSQTLIFDSENLISCTGCESFNCGVYYDVRYGGMRGVCYSCGANWPES